MDQTLRCNNQLDGFCRKALTDEAIVTTCSHIFCIACATKTQFATAPLNERVCPVCRTALPHRNDAIQAQLLPSEDFKTSILSGLDPATIMECASRALAFWTYQTTQEIFYQEHLGRIMKDKYGQLSAGMDKIINEANSEIGSLQSTINRDLTIDQRSLQDKYDELASLYRDKSKKAAQTQKLYDMLKKKVLMSSVENAASENVNNALHNLLTHNRPTTYQDAPSIEPLYPAGGITDRARPDPSQPDLFGKDLRPVGYASHENTDSGRFGDGMPPSVRPVAKRTGSYYPHGNDLMLMSGGHGSAPLGTPTRRVTLPTAGHATANRFQIPVSTSRRDTRPQSTMHDCGSTLNNPRAGHHTPQNIGMLGHMKVGGSGPVGERSGEPRFTRPNGIL